VTLVMLNEDWHDGQDWGGEGWWWVVEWVMGGELTEGRGVTILCCDGCCGGSRKVRLVALEKWCGETRWPSH